ncbi:MAG: penicillin-binding protein 1A [Pseudomonadota bacterium]|nr:penicillin-binding protein 1A [Pseudomonadota bacterium]
MVFFSLALVLIVSLYILPKLPDIETLKDIKMQVPLRIYSADMSLIAEYGEKRRTPIKIEALPNTLIKAFLAAEDDRFYVHPGVDWQGLVRATYSLIKTGTKKQGGSTITMQVARNFFLSHEKTYLRKLNEIFLAFKIERELSKKEILELYVNKIYLGQRAYGVEAAAQVYYGADVNSLNLAQIATIAGLPKAPSKSNPVTNPSRSLIRRNYVLQRMLELSYISEEEFEEAKRAPISATLHIPTPEIEAHYLAEMVRNDLTQRYGEDAYTNGLIVTTTIRDRNQKAANKALRDALLGYDKRHGYRGPEQFIDDIELKSEEDIINILKTFPVFSNLSPGLVKNVNEKSANVHVLNTGEVEINWEGLKWARKYISENKRGPKLKKASEFLKPGDIVRLFKTENNEWVLSQIPNVEGGLISISPNDGSVFALVGGFNYFKNKFNHVTQAKRQAGSGFKPFIYSAALEAGKTSASIINDAPVVFEDPGIEDEWRPENYSRKSHGPTRLREALIHSRNLVSIRLLHSIGIPFALNHIKKFGFDIEQLPKNLSLALGSAELSPWGLVRGYSVFANGGFLVEPYFINETKTYADKIIFRANPLVVCNQCIDIQKEKSSTEEIDTPEEKDGPVSPYRDDSLLNTIYSPRVVDAKNIWIMNSITQDVIKYGTGRRALELQRDDLSGKTGTTNDQHDAWFSGFNSNIVTVSWVGFDKFKPLGIRETGGRAALPMWIDYMREAVKGMPQSVMQRPKGLVTVRVDSKTGEVTNAENPDAMFEVFRLENAPKSLNKKQQSDLLLKDDGAISIPEQLF